MLCACRSSQKNRRRAFVPRLEWAWSVFSPSVLLVSQNLLQMESKISAPEADLFAFSSEVVTLTFSLANVILSTPRLLVFSFHLVLIAPWELCNLKRILKAKCDVKTAQRLAWRVWECCQDWEVRLSKVRYHRSELAAEGTAARCFLFGSLGIFRGLRE